MPQTGHSLAVDADTALRIGHRDIRVVFVLPEAAAEHGRLIGLDRADADTAQLRVSAARDNGDPLGKAGICRSLCVDGAHDAAALNCFGQNIVLQADAA
ncbi:hypothetical protein SDC9_172664 [bioreactor metagenome]|uniref:Uncharacterized protein n=1 Tax=bioreactor metagenome TaxID=1076179 RepID=A0A645GEB3_9ZZZZ